MLIYLDTVLWNTLWNQKIDPDKIKKSLAYRRAHVVPGPHVLYELLKTFHSSRGLAERGRGLLSYFGEFIGPDTPAAKDNQELLTAEIDAIRNGPAAAEMFLSRAGRDAIRIEIENLAMGVLSDQAEAFLAAQKAFASKTRLGQKEHLQVRDDIKTELKSVSPEGLADWLRTTALSPVGIAILTRHLQRFINGVSTAIAIDLASNLLATPVKPFARGVVRADLYYNWRCANRDSVPKDLIDDMYHVLNSMYCDLYATAERKQAEYAHLLLTNTKVAVYDGATPVGQWIESLV
jgi:hypothetical protein